MKYLGVDYGLKKMGLAISEGINASPFKILEITSLKDALEKVSYVISSEEIDKVIIGVSESGESRKITLDFIKGLKGKGIEVIEVEETLSSIEARERMVELGSSKKSRKKDDSVSASIILQNYLDSL